MKNDRASFFSLPIVGMIVLCLALAFPAGGYGQPITEGFNNFDTGTRPAGWTFSGCNENSDTYTTAGNFGVASPSIMMGCSDYMQTKPLLRPCTLAFWVKGIGTDSGDSLMVEEYAVGWGWTEVTTVMPLPDVGTNLGPFPLDLITICVRFTFGCDMTPAELALDDVVITGPGCVTPSTPTPTPTPITTYSPSPSSIPTATPTLASQPWIYDYNGDGTSDIGIFRGSSGLWAIRKITRAYFGRTGDKLIPGDYNGDGTTDIAIYRESTGLWAIRGSTRFYYGSNGSPIPYDYDGDGTWQVGILRQGMWSIQGVGTTFFGREGDIPIPGYYNGDGTADIGIFRPSSVLWAIYGVTRLYFGRSTDSLVPGDYDGDGSWDIGIFRPSAGLWAIKGVTRSYFGSTSYRPVPADYRGDGSDDIGIFRGTSGLWAIKSISRAYFGTSGDVPVTR